MICGAVVVEELRTSFLVEEGDRERRTLEGLGGGRTGHCEGLDKFNLKEENGNRQMRTHFYDCYQKANAEHRTFHRGT